MTGRSSSPAGMVIDVISRSASWQRVLPRAARIAKDAAEAALTFGRGRIQGGRSRAPIEISVVLTGNGEMRRLNRRYRGKDKATNVLSFCGEPPLLGDVVIAFGVAAAEARTEGKTLAAHLSHLVSHGVLHLLGYDHQIERDAEKMEKVETAIMARLGFPDPYAPAPAPVPKRRRKRNP